MTYFACAATLYVQVREWNCRLGAVSLSLRTLCAVVIPSLLTVSVPCSQEMCDPPHYVSMNDKKFAGEMYRFSRSKTFSGLKSDAPKFRQRNSFKL